MSIRYRVLCLLMVVGLAGSPWEMRAQTAPVAASQEENLKGEIWTVTAKQVWTDTRQKTPPPPPWATSKEFEEWLIRNLEPAAKSELGILRGAVIERIGKGQTGSASQVAQAIVDEIAQRRQEKVGTLARVDVTALQTELTPFIQLATPADTTAAAIDSAAPAGVVQQPEASAEAVYQDTIPENVALPEQAMVPVAVAPTYWGMSPAVAGTLLTLLGALIGAGLTYNRMESARRKRRRHSSSHMVATPAAEPETESVMNTPQYRTLKRQNLDLQKQLDQLKKELADLKARVTGVPVAPLKAAPPKRTTAPPPPVQAQADDHDDLLNVELGAIAPPEPAYEQPAAQLPPATRYGPVQETPFVEERKIVDNPLPQLALMLTVNPRNPDQASFTLNPHVNQSMLIGDGLNRLQKFFEYDPPVGRINSVAAAAAGTLQRQADGWQVVERARLIIR